jgi:hypothetical protein
MCVNRIVIDAATGRIESNCAGVNPYRALQA